MSFLAGRLASTEGAFFLQESKNAVSRLAQKLPPPISHSSSSSPLPKEASEVQADVLPEVLRHSLPLNVSIQQQQPPLSTSKWLLQGRFPTARITSDAINPLRAFVSLPQVTFGPRRWQLPDEQYSVVASTANALRRDIIHINADSKKLKAAAEGLSQIGKAFAIATAIVFGGATLTFVLMASKLQLHNIEDVKTKGRDLLQPKVKMVNERLVPLRSWAENISRQRHVGREGEAKEKPAIVKELSMRLGSKSSS